MTNEGVVATVQAPVPSMENNEVAQSTTTLLWETFCKMLA